MFSDLPDSCGREYLQSEGFLMTEDGLPQRLPLVIITQTLKTCVCGGNKLDFQKNNSV